MDLCVFMCFVVSAQGVGTQAPRATKAITAGPMLGGRHAVAMVTGPMVYAKQSAPLKTRATTYHLRCPWPMAIQQNSEQVQLQKRLNFRDGLEQFTPETLQRILKSLRFDPSCQIMAASALKFQQHGLSAQLSAASRQPTRCDLGLTSNQLLGYLFCSWIL